MHHRFDEVDKRFDQQDQKIEAYQQENRDRFDQLDHKLEASKKTGNVSTSLNFSFDSTSLKLTSNRLPNNKTQWIVYGYH